MSSPSDLLRKGYNEMIQPLTSTVGLAEHLADRGYVTMDTVDQLNHLEGEQLVGVSKAKDILVNILVSKGTSKVVEIKKCIRGYSKMTKTVSEIKSYTSGQSNSSYTSSRQSNSSYTSSRQSNSSYTSSRQSNSSTDIVSTLPVEIINFSTLFYTLLHKLLTSYEKSGTVKSRLHWLIPSSTHSIDRYFPNVILKDTSEEVSIEAVMESYKCVLEKYKQVNSCSVSMSDDSELHSRLDELSVRLAQREKDLADALKINEQWSLECNDLKQEIEKLKTIDSERIAENNSSDELLMKIQELETQLHSRNEDYQHLLLEKNELQEKYEQSNGYCELLKTEVNKCQTEVHFMKETNDAILVDMEMLKKESLEDKNCIEELREHISGLKLNSKPNETTAQEMSILLKDNRELTEKLKTAEKSLKKLREEKVTFTDRLQAVLIEKETAEKQLVMIQDELIALRTHVQELEEINKQHKEEPFPLHKVSSSHHRQYTTPINQYQKQEELPLMSFTSQQRKCPACKRVFQSMDQQQFATHVANCFK